MPCGALSNLSMLSPRHFPLPRVGLQPPPFKREHLGKFSLKTLFYIFYMMPRDVLQVHATRELCRRDWRYYPAALTARPSLPPCRTHLPPPSGHREAQQSQPFLGE